MTPDLFWIPGPWRGKLAVMTRPRGGEWLEDEADGWKQAGLDVIISLLEKEEADSLGLGQEARAAESKGIQFISFPIADRAVPNSTSEAIAVLNKAGDWLNRGKIVAVHCRQGLGRSGLIAAGLLVRSGTEAERALAAVSVARGQSVPETPAQAAWVRRLPTGQLLPAS